MSEQTTGGVQMMSEQTTGGVQMMSKGAISMRSTNDVRTYHLYEEFRLCQKVPSI